MNDASPVGHHRPCVLIVEDDDDVREFMQLLVSTAGYETMTARDGQDALVKMRQRRPCLVLLDLQMPRMDGWEFRARQMQDLVPQRYPGRLRDRLLRPRAGHPPARTALHLQACRLPEHYQRRRDHLRGRLRRA